MDFKKLFPFLYPKKRKEKQTELKRKAITKLEDLKRQVKPPFNFVVFDTETNGLTKRDGVLSISASKHFFDGEKITDLGEYERFYFPKGKYNKEAIAVNGLTRRVIRKHRGGFRCKYPKHWFKDIRPFREFIGNDCELVVGHNIAFDAKMLSCIMSSRVKFCTMQSNRSFVKALDKNGRIKAPKLIETAKAYNIPIEEDKLHGSSYDVYLTKEIFIRQITESKIFQEEIVF